jgi:tRNA (mo5U34)-methyltransferase
MESAYDSLKTRWPPDAWIESVCGRAMEKLAQHPHGDLPRWRRALDALPATGPWASLDGPVPRLGGPAPDRESLERRLMELHPWRKGPIELGGVTIDTEWRSDWKWQRVAPHIDLAGHRVLDIGSGNGYFGLRMLGAGARVVLGIDPTLVFVMQWLAFRHFGGDLPSYVLPLAVEELPTGRAELDTVFSMGVLYHRKDPQEHLLRIFDLLRKGGHVVLETLVLPPGREKDLLEPPGRYARMRNVWSIPGTDLLLRWVKAAGFSSPRVVDVTPTTTKEQRSTGWMTFESLDKALDPDDSNLTVEGLPAPIRAVLIAGKP